MKLDSASQRSPRSVTTTSSKNPYQANHSTIHSKPKSSSLDNPTQVYQAETTSRLIVPARKSRKLFRKIISFIVLLQIIGFGGGVYYSKINDNFHDFFTEYVPFGEQAILYLEEREFRKRFPPHSESDPQNSGQYTTISPHSGVSWSVTDGQKPGFLGRHADATDQNSKAMKSSNEKSPVKADSVASPSISESPQKEEIHQPATHVTSEADQLSKESSKSNRIDPININNANEPLVQDLVKIVNDIIAVVDEDNSNGRFSRTIEKAKAQLSTVGSRILAHTEQVMKEAESKIQSEKQDFDRAAKELYRRMEMVQQIQQANWQDEFHNEREKIKTTYDKKLSAEIQRINEINEQRLHNALLEQALQMKKNFTHEIKELVEEERNGRLKKLDDLSSTVNDLEKLTTDWNSVVDYNLKTQQLHIAVEATREIIEKSDTPRPFVRELVALREVASDDPVVNAAIASINPIAYHHGIPSSAQMIDRFRRVAIEVRKAALLPENAGVASHVSSYVLSKLLFKKKGLASGSDVESLLTRAETFLEEGNLDAAAREVNELKGWAKLLSRDWLDEARRVLEVKQALDVSIL